jgi:hypothetical protein
MDKIKRRAGWLTPDAIDELFTKLDEVVDWINRKEAEGVNCMEVDAEEQNEEI